VVIIEATETISKSLRQYLSNITGKNEIKEIKRVILDTKRILRELTIYATCNVFSTSNMLYLYINNLRSMR